MAENIDQYKSIITDLIKKQSVILGPSVALGTAKKVSGLTIAEDGTVIEISGDPHVVLTVLAQGYMALSGQIAQNTLNSVLEKHPDIKDKLA